MSRYWFARSFPLSEPKATRMAPVSGEGWAVVALFVGCLVAGVVGLATFAFTYRQPGVGVVTLLGFTVVGAAALIAAIRLRGDRAHTTEEYRLGKVRQ
ncbi:hypothetical protein [Devosia sp.]|jgi:hypothetical protein|uniref:hypothetical protein n=1 Tax=Devosia sp. TaxID=1871048 RepID=UPI0037C17FB1